MNPVYHVSDRRRDLTHVRLPAGWRLDTDGVGGAGDHHDRVVLTQPDGTVAGRTRLVADRRGTWTWTCDDGSTHASLDGAVAHLLGG